MPAVLGFYCQRKLGWRVRFLHGPSEPGCAQQSVILFVMRNKSAIANTAPAFHVSGNLRATHDIPRKLFVCWSRGQAVILHLPKNGFILTCKRANLVVH